MSDTTIQPSSLARPASSVAARLVPGLALTASIAAAAYGLRLLPGAATFSPMTTATMAPARVHSWGVSPSLTRASRVRALAISRRLP